MLLLFMVSTEVGAGKYTFFVPKCVTGICPYTNAQLYFILESLLSNRSRLITKDITTSNKSANLPCYTSLPLQPWAVPWGNQSWVITLRCSGNKHPRETTFVSCQYNYCPQINCQYKTFYKEINVSPNKHNALHYRMLQFTSLSITTTTWYWLHLNGSYTPLIISGYAVFISYLHLTNISTHSQFGARAHSWCTRVGNTTLYNLFDSTPDLLSQPLR